MISDFEIKLARLLGESLHDSFNKRVKVAPAGFTDNGPFIQLGVTRFELLEEDMSSIQQVKIPGTNKYRRVMNLRCIVHISIHPGTGTTYPELITAFEKTIFFLDDITFRNGKAFEPSKDSGFLIHELRLVEGMKSDKKNNGEVETPQLTYSVEGWFWLTAEEGQAGEVISEVHVRTVTLSVELEPPKPVLIASGPSVELRLIVGVGAEMRLRKPPLAGNDGILPFKKLAVKLQGAGATSPHGTLTGGDSGKEGVKLVDLNKNIASVTYTPQNQGSDELVVGFDNGENGLGMEIGRFTLNVR